MKDAEDEAFDELARKQGSWGGGFPAKRKMAADKLHWSDCAVHNAPAYPAGECDCGVAQKHVAVISAWSLREVYFDEDGEPSMHRSPPQREWVGLTDEERVAVLLDKDGKVLDYEDCVRAIEQMLKEKNNG